MLQAAVSIRRIYPGPNPGFDRQRSDILDGPDYGLNQIPERHTALQGLISSWGGTELWAKTLHSIRI